MIGGQLTRYATTPFLVWDLEAENLNLHSSRPWEIAYAIATLKGGVQSMHTSMIRWPNLIMTPDNPSFKHFDRARYEREARDPREVWSEFSPLLKRHRSAGHNLLGYDSSILKVWQCGIGLVPTDDWLYSPGLIDTNCLSKAYRAGWTPDISSSEAFLAWQYAAYHTRLAKVGKSAPKTKLGVMCGEFGIEYDERLAHGATYDVERNVALLSALAWKVEV